jgi:hypothetical protein
MGEKYDCYYEDAPLLRVQELALRRISNPIGEGFPAPRYGEMLAGGEAAKAALGEYGARAGESIKAAAASATELLRNAADGDPAAKIAAGQEVASHFTDCMKDVQKQTSQANATYQMVSDHGSIPDREIAEIAQGNARALKRTVVDHLGPVEQLIDTVLNTVEDSAVNAIGAHAEAAVNRIGQFAYTNTAGLYNAMRRRGMVDVPDVTDPAA